MLKFLVYFLAVYSFRVISFIPRVVCATLMAIGFIFLFAIEGIVEPFAYIKRMWVDKPIWRKFWKNTTWLATWRMIKKGCKDTWS